MNTTAEFFDDPRVTAAWAAMLVSTLVQPR